MLPLPISVMEVTLLGSPVVNLICASSVLYFCEPTLKVPASVVTISTPLAIVSISSLFLTLT